MFRGTASCATFEPAVTALWSIGAVLYCLNIVLSLVFLARTFTSNKVFVPSLAALGGLAMVASTLLCALCVLRATYPHRVVGTDPTVTVLLSLGSWSFWLLCLCCITRLIVLNVRLLRHRSTSRTSSLYERYGRIGFFGFGVLVTVGCLAPLLTLSPGLSDDGFRAVVSVHYWFCAMAIGLGVPGVYVPVTGILAEVDASIALLAKQPASPAGAAAAAASSSGGVQATTTTTTVSGGHGTELLAVRNRLWLIAREVRNNGVPQIFLAMFWGSWLYLQ